MFSLKRIFWKIFLAFWLGNLFVLGGTAFVVVSTMESSHFRERQRQVIEAIAINIAESYENNGGAVDEKSIGRLFRKIPIHRELIWRGPFRILDENNKVVFENKIGRARFKLRNLNFPIQTISGNRYNVQSYFGPPPKFIADGLRRLNLFQFLLILFVSAIIGLLLSWSIARPLKTLGVFSRRYADGDSKTEIDKKLLRRGDEIGDLARDLNFMREQVEKNINSQKQLMHDVSHELRAPLARLQAVAGLLQQQAPENVSDIDKMHHECERIDGLIQQVLNFSRVEQQVIVEDIEVIALVKEIVESFKYEYPRRVINFHSEPGTLVVRASDMAIEAAIHNVVSNACKYSPESSVVEIVVDTVAGNCRITVRDYGGGVDESELDKLLTPFYRSGNKMHSDGYGLGLSITQRSIYSLGGKIHLANHPQGGFVVTLDIPMHTVAHTGG